MRLRDYATVEYRYNHHIGLSMGKVVTATGVAVIRIHANIGDDIEQAMRKAVLDALADGVSDQQEVRERMLAARQKIKDGTAN